MLEYKVPNNFKIQAAALWGLNNLQIPYFFPILLDNYYN